MSAKFKMTGDEWRKRILFTAAWSVPMVAIVFWMFFYLMPSLTGQEHPYPVHDRVLFGIILLLVAMHALLIWKSAVPKRQIEMLRMEHEDRVIAEAEKIKRKRSSDGAL